MNEEKINEQIEKKPKSLETWQKYTIGAAAILASIITYRELINNSETPKDIPVKCENTWEMTGAEHGKTEWLKSGIVEIVKENDKKPRQALYDWLDKIDNDPALLAYFANNLHAKNKDDIKNIPNSSLIDANNCATNSAQKELKSIKSILETAIISFDQAPTDGINSIVNNDIVEKSKKSGITGNKSAIKITLPNGNSLWILNICGNLVVNEQYPHKNTPKSNNAADYKRPGTDKKQDSGNKIDTTKNTISEPAEKTPPKVITVINTPTNNKKTFSGFVSNIQ